MTGVQTCALPIYKVPVTTNIAIAITNHCIKNGGTVSANIVNGLVNTIAIFLFVRFVVISILILIDQAGNIGIYYVDKIRYYFDLRK